ncbi:MAG: gliding motility-associated C-terminal domain-containing protein [Bacteroidia bacterium]|nr:gliding motility-associated C-terminal domain-containing protein [Bacteroidia bacterium]
MKYYYLHIASIILILLVSISINSYSQSTLKQSKAITNNNIDKYKILCGTSLSLPITGTMPLGVGAIVKFKWIKSLDTLSNIWNVISLTDTFPQYQPPNPGATQNFYKRIVISDGFTDTSNVCVVKVIPGSTNFSANIVNPPTQSIHIGIIPSQFNGTLITGGTLTDTIKFLWLKSQNPNFTVTFPATEGTYLNQNLIFSEGADTTFYYDRFAYILLPSSELACVSYSNPVKVLLLDSNVIVSPDTIICSGMGSSINGNSEINYTYQWQFFNGTIWEDISGATNANYNPLNILTTKKFRRIVIVNGLNVIISNVITIHVTPPIQNNIIYTTTLSTTGISVNYGTTTNIGNTNSPTGGNGTYEFLWRYSNDNITFSTATMPNTFYWYISYAAYDTLYYKRIVNSGFCTSVSNTLAVYPIYPANTISIANSTACNGTALDTIKGTSGTPPVGATFTWEMKSGTSTVWQVIPGVTSENYVPTGITDSASFRRIIHLVSNSYPSNIVTIYSISFTLSATSPIIVCGNNAIMDATPVTTGNGWWTAPALVSFVTSNVLYNSEISVPSFSTNSFSYSLYWHAQNLICEDSVHVSVIFYHAISPPNAGIDISLVNENSTPLSATPPPYGTGYWSVVMGSASFVYSNDAHTVASAISTGENIFKWTVSNGPCGPLSDEVKITVTNSKIPEGFSPNGDGVNDYFEVTGIENYPGSELVVFNRWGTEVFRMRPYDNKWDGKTSGGIILPEDTYFYILKYDNSETKKGYIIIKR